jgi:hypothetical protein
MSTFLPEDVTLLLTDRTGQMEAMPTEKRERCIQSGMHYSEMLPLEYTPSAEYLAEYYRALDAFAKATADAVASVAEMIYSAKGPAVVLVSLARAGTPAGVLITRYLRRKYQSTPTHYTISLVRGRGIDKAAMRYILARHCWEQVQFVDGWTGKGAILQELAQSTAAFRNVGNVRKLLAVLADPANVTDLCGTHRDLPVPSSFLNSTVCGLMSRTLVRPGIGEEEFHGVVFYHELREADRTYEFIERIEKDMEYGESRGMDEVLRIAKDWGIPDINFIKPGIGETTRVLLRRVPRMVLLAEDADADEVAPILRLAEERQVEVKRYPLRRYRACGIIRALGPDV